MSGVGEAKKLLSEDTPDDNESDIENQESSNSPKTATLPGNDQTADSRKPPTNGEEMPPKSTGNQGRDSALSTPPRCDSPTLRKLLTSPIKSKGQSSSSLVGDELQGVANVGGDAAMQEGFVPDALQGAEAIGGDVPEAVHTAEVPKAVQGTAAEGFNVPEGEQIPEAVHEAVQGTEAQGGDVPEIKHIPEAIPEAVQNAGEASVQDTVEGAEKSDIPKAKQGPATAEKSILKSLLQADASSIPKVVKDPVVEEEMHEASESSIPEVAPSAAAADSVPAKSEVKEATEQMRTSESESDAKFKKPAVSSRIQSMKGRLDGMKLDDPSVPESPKRRSSRIENLQRKQSDAPSPKKERKSSRSSTPSEERMTTRGQRRLGSTSSNSEVEGSGDESKGKRVSRKDSRK